MEQCFNKYLLFWTHSSNTGDEQQQQHEKQKIIGVTGKQRYISKHEYANFYEILFH